MRAFFSDPPGCLSVPTADNDPTRMYLRCSTAPFFCFVLNIIISQRQPFVNLAPQILSFCRGDAGGAGMRQRGLLRKASSGLPQTFSPRHTECKHSATDVWFENDTERITFCGIESIRGNVTDKRCGTTHGSFPTTYFQRTTLLTGAQSAGSAPHSNPPSVTN